MGKVKVAGHRFGLVSRTHAREDGSWCGSTGRGGGGSELTKEGDEGGGPITGRKTGWNEHDDGPSGGMGQNEGLNREAWKISFSKFIQSFKFKNQVFKYF
jgi:hypothetical protein